jgi:hypothetical protein
VDFRSAIALSSVSEITFLPTGVCRSLASITIVSGIPQQSDGRHLHEYVSWAGYQSRRSESPPPAKFGPTLAAPAIHRARNQNLCASFAPKPPRLPRAPRTSLASLSSSSDIGLTASVTTSFTALARAPSLPATVLTACSSMLWTESLRFRIEHITNRPKRFPQGYSFLFPGSIFLSEGAFALP